MIVLVCGSTLLSFRPVAHPNFSGAWVLNEQKTTYGPNARAVAKKLTIAASEKGMTLVRVANSRDGQEFTTSETLTFDGKETESTSFGNSKKKSTALWSEDGQVLNVNSTITFEVNGNTIEATVKEVWKMSGEMLTINSEGTSSFGHTSAQAVYDRVK